MRWSQPTKELARKLSQLEHKLVEHDSKFETVFDAIRKLMQPPPASGKSLIGFRTEKNE